jgi:hypothetical protein
MFLIRNLLIKRYHINDETEKRWEQSLSIYSPVAIIDNLTYKEFMSDTSKLKQRLFDSEFLVLSAKPNMGVLVKTKQQYYFFNAKPESIKLLKCL